MTSNGSIPTINTPSINIPLPPPTMNFPDANGNEIQLPRVPTNASKMTRSSDRIELLKMDLPEEAPPEEERVDPAEELKKITDSDLPPIEPDKQLRCIMDCIIPP
uniref:Uncharacterized protein n=3 Tax=Bursaphelenchus xylophilus TaxID=6326 RepID=A0A1I7SHM2_BURXY